MAVLDPRDRFHARAATFYRSSFSQYLYLITTNLVIAETYVNVRRASGHARATAFLDLVEQSERIRCLWSDRQLELRAREILRRYSDQDFSYVDAVSFAVMRRESVDHAFAFDQHFRTMGFAVFPV